MLTGEEERALKLVAESRAGTATVYVQRGPFKYSDTKPKYHVLVGYRVSGLYSHYSTACGYTITCDAAFNDVPNSIVKTKPKLDLICKVCKEKSK